MAFYYGDSATGYSSQRRQRSRSMGGPLEEVVGAETAAFETGGAARAIAVGVATGVLTLLVNRWLEKLLK